MWFQNTQSQQTPLAPDTPSPKSPPPRTRSPLDVLEIVGWSVLLDERYRTQERNTIETLKEILCGSGTKVRVKNAKPGYLESLPIMFITNNELFDIEDNNPNNPWPSRLRVLNTQVYPYWTDETRSRHLHPFAWLRLFREYNLI